MALAVGVTLLTCWRMWIIYSSESGTLLGAVSVETLRYPTIHNTIHNNTLPECPSNYIFKHRPAEGGVQGCTLSVQGKLQCIDVFT
jgi:hypothetical protein